MARLRIEVCGLHCEQVWKGLDEGSQVNKFEQVRSGHMGTPPQKKVNRLTDTRVNVYCSPGDIPGIAKKKGENVED